MTRTQLMFLILRKNSKLLVQYVNGHADARVKTQRRKEIISIKTELASLKVTRYNLVKSIATDIDRFAVVELSRKYKSYSEGVEYYIPHLGHNMPLLTSSNARDIPRVLYDTINQVTFILFNEQTVVDDVILFENDEHKWFSYIFITLEQAKIAEEELIKQQREIELKLNEERKKEGILSKYS